MNIHSIYAPFLRHFREARLRVFYQTFGINEHTTLLDVGGELGFWEMARKVGLPLPRLTIVNLVPVPGCHVLGNAESLPFARQAFDVAFSNSVIEHLGCFERQGRAASEIRRVARRYYVQTPDRRFPIEPHLLTPFVHWLPKEFRLCLLRNGTIHGWIARPDAAACRRFIDEVALLDRHQMEALFPEAQIISERFFGLSKSLIATVT